ncbi:hypothetical protein ACUOCP_18825, partial [Escherichia sp. R-CC3]
AGRGRQDWSAILEQVRVSAGIPDCDQTRSFLSLFV